MESLVYYTYSLYRRVCCRWLAGWLVSLLVGGLGRACGGCGAWQGQGLAETGKELGGLIGWRCLSCGVFSTRFLIVTVGSFKSPRRALSNDGRPRLEGPLPKGYDALRISSARNFEARRRGGFGDRQNKV
jgi:hypothetical protein